MADGPPPRHPPRIDGRSVLIGALLLAIAANLVQFRAIEQAMGTAYMVAARQPDRDLAGIVERSVPTVRERFGLYLAISEWATDADVTLPPDTGLLAEQLYGLGRIGRLTVLDHEPDMPLPVDVDTASVADGEDRHAGPWSLVVSEPPARELVGIHHAGTLYLIDTRVLDTEVAGDVESTGPPR